MLSWINQVGIVKYLFLKITRLGKHHRTAVLKETQKLLNIQEKDRIAWILEENKDSHKKPKNV